MYRVLIVDDERMIRLGMRKAIPWRSIGIGDVFIARSGIEALEIIRGEKPEILITDIKMDEMSGLDLIDQAKTFVMDLRVIVLTGYDDFEYARRCIKLKVHDFFLKPIDKNALMESVGKQVSWLENNKIEKLIDINENRAQAVTEQLQIENFLRKLVHGRITQQSKETDEFCRKYSYDPKQPVQAVIIVPALYENNNKEDEKFEILTIKNICIGLVDARNRGLTFMDDHGMIVIVFFLKTQRGGILDWIKELSGVLKDECDKKPKIVVGSPAENIKDMHLSYSAAVMLLKYEQNGADDFIQSHRDQRKVTLFKEIFIEMKNALCENLEDLETVLKIFGRFRQATNSYNLSDGHIRKCCFELLSAIYYTYICHSGKEADSRLSELINSLSSVEGEKLFQLAIQFLYNLLGKKEEQGYHEIVDNAKRYIAEHLSDNLSVSDIAAFLYISPNYLSRLFKKVTGEGCNEYIIRKRIDRAKLLLETTSLTAGKIAMLVGYRDTNYFSLAMKKNTGMSPKKYREIHLKNKTG